MKTLLYQNLLGPTNNLNVIFVSLDNSVLDKFIDMLPLDIQFILVIYVNKM